MEAYRLTTECKSSPRFEMREDVNYFIFKKEVLKLWLIVFCILPIKKACGGLGNNSNSYNHVAANGLTIYYHKKNGRYSGIWIRKRPL